MKTNVFGRGRRHLCILFVAALLSSIQSNICEADWDTTDQAELSNAGASQSQPSGSFFNWYSETAADAGYATIECYNNNTNTSGTLKTQSVSVGCRRTLKRNWTGGGTPTTKKFKLKYAATRSLPTASASTNLQTEYAYGEYEGEGFVQSGTWSGGCDEWSIKSHAEGCCPQNPTDTNQYFKISVGGGWSLKLGLDGGFTGSLSLNWQSGTGGRTANGTQGGAPTSNSVNGTIEKNSNSSPVDADHTINLNASVQVKGADVLGTTSGDVDLTQFEIIMTDP